MYNVFIPVVLIITALLIIFLLYLLHKQKNPVYSTSYRSQNELIHSTCPLCGSGLTKSEKVKSVLFKGNPDSMMEIYGCPYCYPPNNRVKRICPVCRKELKKDSIVIARVFIKPGKKHVHVLGCSDCYKRKY